MSDLSLVCPEIIFYFFSGIFNLLPDLLKFILKGVDCLIVVILRYLNRHICISILVVLFHKQFFCTLSSVFADILELSSRVFYINAIFVSLGI